MALVIVPMLVLVLLMLVAIVSTRFQHVFLPISMAFVVVSMLVLVLVIVIIARNMREIAVAQILNRIIERIAFGGIVREWNAGSKASKQDRKGKENRWTHCVGIDGRSRGTN